MGYAIEPFDLVGGFRPGARAAQIPRHISLFAQLLLEVSPMAITDLGSPYGFWIWVTVRQLARTNPKSTSYVADEGSTD